MNNPVVPLCSLSRWFTKAFWQMISVSGAPRTPWSASMSLFESPLCFLLGFHYSLLCVHSGPLKGLTESIVHKSFWWQLLLLYSFLSCFFSSVSPLPSSRLLPSPANSSPLCPPLTWLPLPRLCSALPHIPLRWHLVVQPSSNSLKLGQGQVRAHLSVSSILFFVFLLRDGFSV